jgi:hypothetical protein
MTQEAQETIKFARHWLEVADKHGDPNAPTTGCMTALAKAVVDLAEELQGGVRANMDNLEALDHQEFLLDKANTELAALKERCRWRKQSEEPAPKNQLVEVCESAKDGYIDSTYGFGVEDWAFWRPLDLPEMEAAK